MNKNLSSFIFYLVSFILIILTVIGIKRFFRTENKINIERPVQSHKLVVTLQPPKNQSQLSYLKFQNTDNKKIFVEKGNDISLSIVGNSIGKKVLGFDIAIDYNPSLIKWKNTENILSSSYRLITRDYNKGIYISGVLKEPTAQAQVFNENIITNVTFETLNVGEYNISIVNKNNDMTESNMFSEEKKDILEQTNNIVVVVGKKYILTLGELVKIDEQQSILLKKIDVPNDSCRDCIETVVLELLNSKDNTRHEIQFTSGGFAGLIQDEAEYNNLLLKLLNRSNSVAEVLINTQ